MNTKFSSEILDKLIVIKKRDSKLFSKIRKQLALFEENPKHPSLRKHKLTGGSDDLWSISINMSFRMIYKQLDQNTAYFTKMGTHEEVYRR